MRGSASGIATRTYAGSATLCDAVHWTRQSERRCSGCDEGDGRGRWGLRKRRAVGDGRRAREAALMAALQRTWRGRGLLMPGACTWWLSVVENTCGCYCEQAGPGRGDGLPCAVLCADVGGSGWARAWARANWHQAWAGMGMGI